MITSSTPFRLMRPNATLREIHAADYHARPYAAHGYSDDPDLAPAPRKETPLSCFA